MQTPEIHKSGSFCFISEDSFCRLKAANAAKNSVPITPLAAATAPEGSDMYLTNIPMLPKISIAADSLIIPDFPFIKPSFHKTAASADKCKRRKNYISAGVT